jgi:cytochrome c556
MTRRNKFLASIAFATLAVGTMVPAAIAADAKPDAVVYREHIMNTLEVQVAALGQILSGATPDDQVVSHLETIAETASQALKSFEPKVEGGEALPVVWQKWDDFSARMKDFQAKTRAAADTAKAQGKDAALANILDALRCKDCHDIYRTKQ